MQAGNHCASMENNARRIRALHAETHESDAAVTADIFASKMELSDRLLEATRMVEASVQTARQDLAAAERQNFAAQALHDGTERLLKSKVSILRKTANRKADSSSNMLYNIDNHKKKERRDDR